MTFYGVLGRADRFVKTTTKIAATALLGVLLTQPGFADDTLHRKPRWDLCPDEVLAPPRPTDAELPPGFTSLDADRAHMVKNGRSIFTGNVELLRDDQAVETDRLEYDDPSDTVDATGHTRLWYGSLFWQGQHAHLDMDSDFAKLEQGFYALLDLHGHGSAKRIETDHRNRKSKLKDATYTTCPGDVPDWQLSSSSIFLDHIDERGSARNVILRVHDVPVFYFPFVSFPLSDKRKTGFLTPSWGTTSQSGVDIRTPYYWNIAPNMDATFTPQLLSDRGVMLGGEFRHLSYTSRSQVSMEVLPDDQTRGSRTRSLVSVQHNQSFAQGRAKLAVDFNQASDSHYFEDFGNSLSLSSTTFLNRRAVLSYSGGWWNTSALVNRYQTVDPGLPVTSRPYNILPRVTLNATLPYSPAGFQFNLTSQATYFDRDGTVVGGRLYVKPSVSYPLKTAGTFFIPTVSLEQTSYYLDNTAGANDRPSRTNPLVTVDSGLYFERDTAFGGHKMLQTLEPRVYYLYRPKVNQDDIPIFDTSLYDFTYNQLFRDNRFSGLDRLGDANSVSLAVTSRLINPTSGWEWLRGSIGQIYYLTNQEVTLPGRLANNDSTSEIVGELYARVTSSWSGIADLRWDPNNGHTNLATFRVRYQPSDDKVLNVAYRLNKTGTSIEQTDVSGRWPLSRSWGLVGRWNYSIPDNQTLEAMGGLEYESCCWGLRAVARRYLSTTAGTYSTAVFLQLELKGLAGIGGSALSLIRNSVPGYRNTF